jgi:molecular chaperone GrpE
VTKGGKKNPGVMTPEEPAQPAEHALEARISELELELKHEKEQLLRTLADFDNYRKRLGREIDDIGKAGKRDVLLGVLAIMDSFERGLQSEALKIDHPIHAGVISIYRQLQHLLEQHQVMGFDSLGQRFDPNLHQATEAEFSQRYPEGIITQEVQKGYLWEGKVLRPAQVIVSKGSPSAEAPRLDVWE